MAGLRSPRAALADLTPYRGEMPAGKLILAANESPFNLPVVLREKLQARSADFPFNRYPDPLAQKLRAKLAAAQGVATDCILLGNGGDELLLDIMLAWGGTGRTMLQFTPTFSMYEIYAQTLGTEVVSLPRDPDTYGIDIEAATERLQAGDIDLCFLDNPNNPSGNLTDTASLLTLIAASDCLFVVDEAYFEFSGQSMRAYLDQLPNLVILRTFSKAYSLAGLRLGYVLASPQVIEQLSRVRMPYSVNAFTQFVAELVVDMPEEFDRNIATIIEQRDSLYAQMSAFAGVEVWQSAANFLLFRLPRAAAVWQCLLDDYDIYVRNFSQAAGLENCLRVTVGDAQQNARFMTALSAAIARSTDKRD